MSDTFISVPLQGPSPSAATAYLKRVHGHSATSSPESQLLKAIRLALRGADTELLSDIQTASLPSASDGRERGLTWDAQMVVLSYGGVMKKKWDLTEEGQSIQWACLGELEQIQPTSSSSNSDSESLPSDPPSSHGRSTFGPFIRSHINPKPDPGKPVLVSAIFVFLRSIGKIFLENGYEYTFSLPFIVRKAWPLSPQGVILQRVIEPGEFAEAEISGDVPLPTIFSITSPFAEASAVGLTDGIIGDNLGVPVSLKDEDENSSRPLKSIPPAEMIVWVSHQGPASNKDIVVTVDAQKRQLSVWRYAHVKPKDTPVPLARPQTQGVTKPRQSVAGMGLPQPSSVFNDTARIDPFSPKLPRDPSPSPDLFNVLRMPPLSALPGMPPALSTTTTMQSLVSGGTSSQSEWSQTHPAKGRRNSLTRNDLSVTMDRMALGGRIESDLALAPIDHGRMRAAYWMEKVYSQELQEDDARSWRNISVALFDNRWDGSTERCLMSICLPKAQELVLFTVTYVEGQIMKVTELSHSSAVCATAIRATRDCVWDLLAVKPNGSLVVLTHGTREIPIVVKDPETNLPSEHGKPVSLQDVSSSSVTLIFEDGWKSRACFELYPKDMLTGECLRMLALALPADAAFAIHLAFLQQWATKNFSTAGSIEFETLSEALLRVFNLASLSSTTGLNPWTLLSHSTTHMRLRDDPALRNLQLPSTSPSISPILSPKKPHGLLAPVLYALHTLGEYLRLFVQRYDSVEKLAPIICRIAIEIRPEWADYWKRLAPDSLISWPSPAAAIQNNLDDRLPVWPFDASAILYGRISNPDWKAPWQDSKYISIQFRISPSFAFGSSDPLKKLQDLTAIFQCLSDSSVDTVKRAQNAIYKMTTMYECNFMDSLPLGIAAPLREAARTCQLLPPGDWPLEAYTAIGRNDLAASASNSDDMAFNYGYKPIQHFFNPSQPRQTIGQISAAAKAAGSGDIDLASGVEVNLQYFPKLRFGTDRRLEEVARILCSSNIPSIKMIERPDLSENDQNKEYQMQVIRVAERTLAQPYGRALFTFGSIPTVTREAYAIPKLEYSVRVQPQNITVAPEAGKIALESMNWGEFHNGVAAGLRIAPNATGVESSWIAFNKPSELTPEHAGFLLGLGLTGHLKQMLTWHTFSYLTPKHDLTSIGVLLGLSAANLGSSDQHVTKLLAVHTPALLPTPSVDLNVSLLTQAAGLAGVGLLYMGTKNRRMAEVCLNQISRRDLVQPDLSNEHREAYTYATALAFGMIMVGKGSAIPADMALLSRLSILIHGDANVVLGKRTRPAFDINLTSPAATIALGLMYLRTERQDIAEILAIPDTVIALNRIQPSFLLIRTIARSLIMWKAIAPTNEWLVRQIPASIREAIELRAKLKPIDDSMELAYYNILAGCCFVVGLKYAGTASQEAYVMIVRYFDLFTRLVYSNGPAFDHKIKRSAVRDGLNLISVSLSMVMAGTGEISCLRRLRYSYGMYQAAIYLHGFKYGVHVATYQAMGLLFLGGGRYTLGTSDAAIACLVTAFFPRFYQVSSDNKSFLQALRHLWVLAVEPRCLIAKDVDTSEVVYLPVKITIKEGEQRAEPQLVAPTLIPDIDKIMRIRVDTPRYWPIFIDTEALPRHKAMLLKSRPLYVKRRTAFLSYAEDPRGSRSLFVRSGSSTGDAATLDFPQIKDARTHQASDLSEFITSFSNDVLFLAFADHFSLREGETEDEQLFQTYCHAALLDSILQDKPQTLQSHLTLYIYRNMKPTSRYFHLRLQDLRFAFDFYSKVYDRWFSGRPENAPRPPLLRDSTVFGALHALDARLDKVRLEPNVTETIGRYARGESLTVDVSYATPTEKGIEPILGWYLLRNCMPVSTILVVLRGFAREAHARCLEAVPPNGTSDEDGLDLGIREVLHATGTKMTTALGSGWSVRSVDEVMKAWKEVTPPS